MLFVVIEIAPPPHLCFLIFAKPFTCHTERRKPKSEDREVAVLAEERAQDSNNIEKSVTFFNFFCFLI
jgi:hypothetical protein